MPLIPKAGTAPSRKAKNDHALRQLQEFCQTLQPGDRIPLHTDLMQRLQVSERAVLRALDEMHRAGRLVRRPRSGTFIADPQSVAPLLDNQTIVAVIRSDHSFNDRCLDLLCHYAEAANLNLVCKMIGSGTDVEDIQLAATVTPGVNPCGFIVFSVVLEPLAKQLQDDGANVVIFGAPTLGAPLRVPYVYGDHDQGGCLMTRHLISLGHRRLAYAHSHPTESLRWRGHERALQEARRQGIAIECDILPLNIEQWETRPDPLVAYLRSPGAPTGLICWNDHDAARLLSVLQRAGIRVPQDVSLTGYDDLPEGRTTYPALTTIDHGIGQQLRAAVDLLAQSRPSPSGFVSTVIPTLICRESTGPVRTSPGEPQ